MNDTFLKQGLSSQGLPIYEADIYYIHTILHTIHQAESFTEAFPHLNEEVPITVVDKELML